MRATSAAPAQLRDDISGAVTAAWSLIGDDTGATITNNGGNQIGTASVPIDPYLLPLADNGGPTMTHAVQAFSPARDMGDPAAVPDVNGVPEFDQRGTGFCAKLGRGSTSEPMKLLRPSFCVSTTVDELDTDLSFGDLSLREAVNYANNAGEPTTICLPEDEYGLMHSGGDLDITGNVTILGDGPGLSIIDGSASPSGRILDVADMGVLNISRVTLAWGHGTSNSAQRNGGAIRVQNGGELHMDNSAVVGNETGGWGLGGGIYFASTASGSIESSVITANIADQQTGGLYLADASSGGGTVTIETTIIANNWDAEETDYPDIYVGSGRTLQSLGYNRLTTGADGFTPLSTDYIKPPGDTVHYVVTSIADTYNASPNSMNLSVREAIGLANASPGTQEIWLPAWDFNLTRDRATYGGGSVTDTSIAFGDLDITDSLVIRGIDGSTSVAWPAGASRCGLRAAGRLRW